MRRLLPILLLIATTIASAPVAAENAAWSGHRADTLPQGRWEVGVFSPLRYGLTDDLELSTHPLAFFVVPNVSAKYSWNESKPWRLSTRHGIHYPTPLLRMVAREGAGGILPANTDVPHIIGITNEIVATTTVPLFRRWFSVRLGFTVAPDIGEETLPAMEFPIVFPRTAAYGNFGTGHAGISLEGEIGGPFYYFLDTTMFIIPGYEGAFAFENTLQLSWRPGEKFMLTAGGRGIYGGYPYGERIHVVPMVDAKFGF
jgi:hypothetical protein